MQSTTPVSGTSRALMIYRLHFWLKQPTLQEDLQSTASKGLLPAAEHFSSSSPAAEDGRRRPGSASQHAASGRHTLQAQAADEEQRLPGGGHSKTKLTSLRTERSSFVEQTRDMLRQEQWSLTGRL